MGMCGGVHECVWVCTGVHECGGYAQVCSGVGGSARVCAGVHGYARVCASVWDEFSEFLLENSLHQRTLIHILYEFFIFN